LNVYTGLGFRSKPVFSAEIDWKLRGAVDQFAGLLISTGGRN